jgi:hypothetical protein
MFSEHTDRGHPLPGSLTTTGAFLKLFLGGFGIAPPKAARLTSGRALGHLARTLLELDSDAQAS